MHCLECRVGAVGDGEGSGICFLPEKSEDCFIAFERFSGSIA